MDFPKEYASESPVKSVATHPPKETPSKAKDVFNVIQDHGIQENNKTEYKDEINASSAVHLENVGNVKLTAKESRNNITTFERTHVNNNKKI